MEDVFPIQSLETQLDARHETIGLDIYVIPEERLILIDSQPLFSASMLMALIQRGDHYSNISTITQNKLSPDILSIENYVDLVAVQLGLLLFSICHTVLVVMDDDIGDGSGGDADGMVTMNRDLKMLRFVQTMRMLQKGIPNSLVEENTEYIPDVVFIYNRVNSRTIESDFCVRQVERFLDSYMTNTTIRKNGKTFSTTLTFPGLINPSIDCALNKSSNRVNLFLLPDSNDTHNYSVLVRTLRNALLNMPKTLLARTVSERDWLLNTARIWELIRKSPFIAEFNRSYQKLALYKIP
jgi:protein SMG9